jgi:2-polyprenyl-6-methoxyphenol hydroxylase-like FAD-dependent oxidoreductase
VSDLAERVVIAGMGPAGMVAALGLALAGVPVVVLEAGAALAEESRASTFHPPSLELLATLGVTDELMATGLRAPVFQQRDRRDGVLAELDLGLLAGETAYPFRLQSEQDNLTRIICDRLSGMDHVDLRFSSPVTRAETTSDGVLVHLDGERAPVPARWLIAADGAHSRVRAGLGIAFEGITYPERFLVVSTGHDWTDTFPDLAMVAYIADPDEWMVLLRTPRHWRALFPVDGGGDAEILDPANVQRRLQGVHPSAEPYPVLHSTLYRVHQRVAASFARGRILLVGDAAHINNPLGGLGMNSGIHDAVSATRTVLAELGGAPAGRCAQIYDTVRRETSLSYVQAETHKNRDALAERSEDARQARARELSELVADPDALRASLRRSSMLASARRALARLDAGLTAVTAEPSAWVERPLPPPGSTIGTPAGPGGGTWARVDHAGPAEDLAPVLDAVRDAAGTGAELVVDLPAVATDDIAEATRQLERCGAAALILDADRVVPGRGPCPCPRLTAALGARQRTLVLARIDVTEAEGMGWARASCQAGADGVVLVGSPDGSTLVRYASELPGVALVVESSDADAAELARMAPVIVVRPSREALMSPALGDSRKE